MLIINYGTLQVKVKAISPQIMQMYSVVKDDLVIW